MLIKVDKREMVYLYRAKEAINKDKQETVQNANSKEYTRRCSTV